MQDDPFVVLESTSAPANSTPGEFSDPLEEIAKLGKSGTAKTGASSVGGEVFDDLDPLSGFNKPVRPLFPEKKTGGKDRSPSKVGPGRRDAHNSTSRETIGTQSFRYSGSHSQKKAPGDSFQESPHFDMPSEDPLRSFGEAAPPPYADNDLHETTSKWIHPHDRNNTCGLLMIYGLLYQRFLVLHSLQVLHLHRDHHLQYHGTVQS